MPLPRTIRLRHGAGRRGRRLGASLCATAVLLAGCGTSTTSGTGVLNKLQVRPGAGGSAPAANPSGLPSTGPGASTTPPSTTPSTPTTPASTPTHPTSPPSSAAPYPSDYAGAVLSAWASHDLLRLTLLMDATDAAQLLAIGDPDRHWTAVPGGGGAAGSSYPTYYNNNGDWLVLKINDGDLAAKIFHAGRLNEWDPISYPSGASGYAKEFVDGWINGNTARMTKLSSASITAYFLTLTTPDFSYTLGAPDGTAGHEHVEVVEGSVSLDTSLAMVTATLGHAHAIDGCSPGCT